MKGDKIPNGLLLQWEREEYQLQGNANSSMPLVAYLLAPARRLFWGKASSHLANLKKEMSALDKKFFVHVHDFKENVDRIQFEPPMLDDKGVAIPNQQPIPKLNPGFTNEEYNIELQKLMSQFYVMT